MPNILCVEVENICNTKASLTTIKRSWAATSLVMLVMAFAPLAHAQAPNLGTAASFAVLAGSTVTNTGPTVLTGNLGVSPGSAITGFPPGIILAPGAMHGADAVAVQAQIDLTIGYNAIAARPSTANLTGEDLGGLTLTPGVYNFNSAAQLTGTLTLNALGNPNAVFIFNVGSTLSTGSASTVRVIGGGNANNVYWRIGSSATLGTATTFVGDILALTSITLNTGATISCGSALAQNGAVTLDTNTIGIRNLAPCVAALLPVTPVDTPVGPPPMPTPLNPVVTAIETAFTTNGGNIPQAFLNLAARSPGDLINFLLPQLTGEAGVGISQAGIQSMNSFLSLVLNPFAGNQAAEGRDGLGPDRQPGEPPLRTLGFAPEAALEPARVSAYAAINKAAAPAFIPYTPQRWSAWAAAYGSQSNTSAEMLGLHDRSTRVYGFASGYDYRVAPNTVVGFALGGGGTNYGISDSLGSGRSDMFQAAVYSSTRISSAYLSAVLAYAWHRVASDRWLTVEGSDHLAADFSAQSVGGRLEGGYRFALPGMLDMPGLGVTPYAAVQAQTFYTPGYSEHAVSGSDVFALNYDARTANVLRTELGAWVDQVVVIANRSTVTLRVRAAWAHDEFTRPTVVAAFQSLPGSAFTVRGARPTSDSALLSVGAWMRIAQNVTVGAKFDSEVADRSQTYAGTATARYTW